MLKKISFFNPSYSQMLPVAVFLTLALVSPANGQNHILGEETPVDNVPSSRNENSTPRISILPVSPAVASNKVRTSDSIDAETVLRLKAILMHLGYDVGQPNSGITAKFKAAVYKYQKGNHLPATGKLDPATLHALRGQ